jgi:hypothetical protein
MAIPNVPAKYAEHWRHPWTDAARKSRGFRRWLNKHGYLTPHFRISEARCKHCGRLPFVVKVRARKHAFNLERFRHELGDRPVSILSWFRCRTHNTNIGGATNSRHMKGDATDHTKQWVERVGRSRFNAAAEKVFQSGGVGSYPSGSKHLDSRGTRARWSSF